ncbi:MAG: T9SS type A sorting domain-containing protein, partial [Bacteroidales bacterium]|nr:T9SS type A sorting domain-containing protein [Bacteroidales bacterium]
ELGITNHGVIYAATFGRGLYTSNTFESKGGSTFTNPIVASNIEVNITPNPVSDVATIRYSIENDSPVLFQVYNLQGQLVKNINLGNQPAGSNEMSFDSSDLGSGTFLIRMNAGNQQTTSKFVVR